MPRLSAPVAVLARRPAGGRGGRLLRRRHRDHQQADQERHHPGQGPQRQDGHEAEGPAGSGRASRGERRPGSGRHPGPAWGERLRARPSGTTITGTWYIDDQVSGPSDVGHEVAPSGTKPDQLIFSTNAFFAPPPRGLEREQCVHRHDRSAHGASRHPVRLRRVRGERSRRLVLGHRQPGTASRSASPPPAQATPTPTAPGPTTPPERPQPWFFGFFGLAGCSTLPTQVIGLNLAAGRKRHGRQLAVRGHQVDQARGRLRRRSRSAGRQGRAGAGLELGLERVRLHQGALVVGDVQGDAGAAEVGLTEVLRRDHHVEQRGTARPAASSCQSASSLIGTRRSCRTRSESTADLTLGRVARRRWRSRRGLARCPGR